MKSASAASLGVLVLAIGLLGTLTAQEKKVARPANLAAPGNVLVLPGTNVWRFPGGTNLFRLPDRSQRRVPGTNQATAPELLKPGVYEASPYTCIVIVPGPQPDDKCIIGRGGAGGTTVDPRMPILKPELRLIPHGAK